MKVLVTGATGQLGSHVVKHLLKTLPAAQLAVSVRDPQKAQELKELGVDVRHGDFERPETLAGAFAGIDKALLISSSAGDRVAQHTAAIEAAKAAGVSFIVYTSAPNAADSSFFLAQDHRETEKALAASGIPHAILRNNWYLENEAGSIHAALNGAPWLISSGTGKAGWALRRDYAEAAANVLIGEGHEGAVYELSGPLRTQEELAAIVGEAAGKSIQVIHVDDEAFGEAMKQAGVPEQAMPFVVGIPAAIREGVLEVESDDLEKLLGRPLTPLAEGVQELQKG